MFWQLYSDIEREVKDLMYSVPFCREHKNVYSPRIAELIVRVGLQIESSLQKDSTTKTNYNTIIERWDKKWNFSDKYVLLNEKFITPAKSSGLYLLPLKCADDKKSIVNDIVLYASKNNPNSFSSNIPKDERVKTYTWANAYNNLKHNFYGSMKTFGTVQNLIVILAALYIINMFIDPELKALNHYNGLSCSSGTDLYKKSVLFSTLTLQTYAIGDKLIIDSVKGLGFENYSFINIKNIELAQKVVSNMIGDDWEFMTEEYKHYAIPKIIKEYFPNFDMYKNYDITIRNKMKISDFV